MAEDFDNDIGSEKELDLGTTISRVGSNEDNQPNVLMPNLDDEGKLAFTDLESGCGCFNNQLS